MCVGVGEENNCLFNTIEWSHLGFSQSGASVRANKPLSNFHHRLNIESSYVTHWFEMAFWLLESPFRSLKWTY